MIFASVEKKEAPRGEKLSSVNISSAGCFRGEGASDGPGQMFYCCVENKEVGSSGTEQELHVSLLQE
jgi:hypothetical protein